MPVLGSVDSKGVLRFSGDINDCRTFLRSFGLECTHKGWGKPGWNGMIEFWKGEFHAAAWRDDTDRSTNVGTHEKGTNSRSNG